MVAADASDTRFDNTLELRDAIGSSTGLGNMFPGGTWDLFSRAESRLDLNTVQAAIPRRGVLHG